MNYSVIFLGRKPQAVSALKFLISHHIQIKAVVAPNIEPYPVSLSQFSEKNGLPFYTSSQIEPLITARKLKVDLVISYLHQKIIRIPLIAAGNNGCVNYHPAILPNYKGLGGYNLAILHGLKKWGSTVHYIDSEKIDSGPIINISLFSIDPDQETALSLCNKTEKIMLQQFKKTILGLIRKKTNQTLPNTGGFYFHKHDYDRYKRISFDETEKQLDRKIRAFWYPPYDGAFLEKNGKRYTLISSEILKSLEIKNA